MCLYVITVHDNFKGASNGFPAISQRDVTTLLLAMMLFEILVTADPKYVCPGDKPSFFNEMYEEALRNERMILEYQKSSKKIYKDYREMVELLNSGAFCEQFENATSIS